MDNKNIAKNAKYICEYCCIKTNNKFDFDKHFLTRKHLKNIAKITPNNGLDKEPAIIAKNDENIANTNEYEICESKPYVCCCGKKYLYASGLSKHKKKCNTKEQPSQNMMGKQDLIMYLMKENKEFKELLIEQNAKLMELAKEGKIINNTTNNTNNTNNSNNFNMNIFLNEKCANALNIMDFVNQMQLQLTDLEAVGQLGYVDGISKIFLRGLKELDITKRPIHCSDLKRETMYIKDNNEWGKDDEEKHKIKKAIQIVAHKNMKQLKEWKQENPDYEDVTSKKNDQYMVMLSNYCGSNNEEDEKYYNKIVKNLAKEVVINK
jgi:hypothetical protein